MEIRSGTGSLSLQVALSSLPTLARAWSAGQTLEALVLRVDPAQGTVVLQLPQGEVEARSEIPLQPGTRLQVMPEPSADGSRLLLRVQNGTSQETRLAALRQALPREAPLAPLFDALEELLRLPEKLPAPVRVQAQALMQARPTPERLATPDGLRKALRNSGVQLEATLADPEAPPPATDLKARMLTLLSALAAAPKAAPGANAPPTTPVTPPVTTGVPPPEGTPAPNGAPRATTQTAAAESKVPSPVVAPPADPLELLSRHVEGALARIQLHQLQALPDAQPQPQWLFELPLQTAQGNDTLRLRFEREPEQASTGAKQAPAWRVTIDLSHPDHGAVRAIVAWRGGAVSARFFAEREATAERFRRHSPLLGERLAAAGIAVSAMEVHTGIPATPARPAASLLSERA